jgi:hypothetical protein
LAVVLDLPVPPRKEWIEMILATVKSPFLTEIPRVIYKYGKSSEEILLYHQNGIRRNFLFRVNNRVL